MWGCAERAPTPESHTNQPAVCSKSTLAYLLEAQNHELNQTKHIAESDVVLQRRCCHAEKTTDHLVYRFCRWRRRKRPDPSVRLRGPGREDRNPHDQVVR